MKTATGAAQLNHTIEAMRASPRFKLRWWPAVWLPLVFFGLGLAVLPQPGLQYDEVLFATPVFHLPAATVFDVHIFHNQLPLMLLTYLGVSLPKEE